MEKIMYSELTALLKVLSYWNLNCIVLDGLTEVQET